MVKSKEEIFNNIINDDLDGVWDKAINDKAFRVFYQSNHKYNPDDVDTPEEAQKNFLMSYLNWKYDQNSATVISEYPEQFKPNLNYVSNKLKYLNQLREKGIIISDENKNAIINANSQEQLDKIINNIENSPSYDKIRGIYLDEFKKQNVQLTDNELKQINEAKNINELNSATQIVYARMNKAYEENYLNSKSEFMSGKEVSEISLSEQQSEVVQDNPETKMVSEKNIPVPTPKPEIINNTQPKYVSLNISPVNKNNNASGVNKSRINYILGDNGILRELFGNTNGLVFPYTPTISEDVSPAYNSVDLPHTNLAPKAHSNTQPPSIIIKSSWTCEDEDNAKRMYGALLFVKSLSLANFGKMSTKEDRGLPPPILYLNGWGDLYTNVPVVITNYSYSLPDNIHYVNVKINKNVNVWLPMILDLSITLGIQPNIDTYRNEFNLAQFKKDMMLSSTKSGQGFGYTW